MLDDRAAPARSVARHGGIAPTRWNRLTLGDSVAVLGHFARTFGRASGSTGSAALSPLPGVAKRDCHPVRPAGAQ
jgi:hypothetical protein